MRQAEKSGTKRSVGDGSIRVIARAAAILRAMRSHPEGLSLSELAQEVGLARSTVHRIIGSLEAEQFVVPASTNGGYRLGPALAVLGAAVNHNLRDQLRPFLDQLFLEIDETIDLAIMDRDRLVFIDQIATPQRLQAVSGVGVSFPLHCTANGKAMLAKLDSEMIGQILKSPLPAFTPNSITSLEELLRELEEIRKFGIAFDLEEHTLGICAVGVAFWDPMGVLAAISIPVPSIRFHGKKDRLVEALVKWHGQIQEHLATI